ncbi:carbohydrate esterase family 1 protein [Schizophyllum commune H4-8]|uniref:Carboxylic ester hydrolase n=1 Tax=Schizophyllum commune (strain H4-8 / FGSC 9210) TaxID=578458 RepID=D8PLI8_SCHCM|nr:carbohydrate esterase family 1 protein [Schizophyllum commune H4-8]KAI5894374.1 carbohydrate esterase family 1 protein [Schizophyllum commune H4-8]
MKFSKVTSLLAAAGAASAASLQQVSNFGTNPTGVQMFIYVPDQLAANPPIIVAMHYCTGTAQAYFQGTQYANLANSMGFIVIYPDAPDSGGCWDVHSDATLTHDAGGDSLGIASMVRYTIDQYGADPARVFATGTSSGAMMTNVLIGAYPDLFAAGAAFSGVPYGCFAGPSMWNSQCAQGQLIKSAQEWGDQARSGYSGFSGTRPKMQVWHGSADTTLYPQNFYEEVKQWTNVLGYAEGSGTNSSNDPLSGYTRTTYGPDFEAIFAQGVGHTVPEQANDVLRFFGLA